MSDKFNEEFDGDLDNVVVELEGEEFEVIDIIEFEGKNYAALTKYLGEDEEDDSDEGEFIILEVLDDPDEKLCVLKTVDDDELYSRIGDAFMKMFEEVFSDIDDE